MQSTQCTRTTRVGVHKRALGGKAIDGAKLSISAWPRRDQTPNGHWCKRLNISPTNFSYEQPLLQAFASNFPWRLSAAAAAGAAAVAPSVQKWIGQPVIAFCLFLLPCFTTATYTTTKPPSVVVCFFTPSRLLWFFFFSFVPSQFSLYVSWSGIYDRLLTAKSKAEWKQELFHSSAASYIHTLGGVKSAITYSTVF